MRKLLLATAAVVAFGAASATPASATVIQIGSQAAFSASGTIVQNTNWDSYGAGFFFPGSPFVVGDLTFIAGGQNLIGGVGTVYNFARNLFTDNNVLGTMALIANSYDLLGFNAGNFFGTGTTTFVIATNLGSYTFPDNVNTATNLAPLSFFGFKAGAGESFSSISWSGSQATGITDVQIGESKIPEPTALVLLGMGLTSLGLIRRRRA